MTLTKKLGIHVIRSCLQAVEANAPGLDPGVEADNP